MRAAASELDYYDNKAVAAELQALAAAHPALLRVRSLGETQGKNQVWLAEAGAGSGEERRTRPALLVVAGVEGNDLAGTSIALSWLRDLLDRQADDDAAKRVLDSTTIYVFPRLNPDAAEAFFATPKWENTTNRTPTDDDRDGLVDEDPPDDLNGDGLITWMRIEDAEGDFILDPNEPRLLIKADRAKGEAGRWRYLVEGRDNDGDEEWNEDGLGGVNLNRNFPYNYRFFAPGSGRHQVSEAESRALADFVIDHPNIGITFTFGAADNLVQTPKGEAGGKRPPTAIQEDDLPFYRELGKAFRDALGLKKELSARSEAGTFSDWMYFHRGRLSLAARPWSAALQLELSKAEPPKEAEKSKPPETASGRDAAQENKPAAASEASPAPKKSESKEKPSEDGRNTDNRAFLKWLDENAPEAFVAWKSFDHPDFPGKKVEIGGFAPLAESNPPRASLKDLAKKHAQFLTLLAGKLPRIAIRQASAKHLSESVYEITVQVENTGYLPTALAQGSLTREVLPTWVELELDDKQILAGKRRSSIGAIEGSRGMKELSYTIHARGKDRLTLEVVSALGGSVRTTIPLQKAD